MADKQWNKEYTLPDPADYNSYQKEIYAAFRSPKYPTSFQGWEDAARKKVPYPNFMYVKGSASSCRTYDFNLAAFDRYRLKPRMLVNTTVRDVSIELFGRKFATPLILCPVGVQGIMHKHGEIATAKAAHALRIPYVHSSAAVHSLEEAAIANKDGERWYQLYWPRPQREDVTVSVLNRAQENGYRVLVVTLDTFSLAWRPHDLDSGYLPFLKGQGNAMGFADPIFNAQYQEQLALDQRPASEKLKDLWGLIRRNGTAYGALSIFWNRQAIQKSLAWLQVGQSGTFREWEHLEILKKIWKGPIVLKGIQTVEDMHKAIEYGMDGVWVSNHGGRQVDGAIASLDALAEIADDEAVKRSGIKLIFDSGIRTGSDVLKAFALGAHAVGIGRPFVYGLGMGGQEGVEHVFKCLMADTDNMLGNIGKKSLSDLSRGDLQIRAFDAKL